MTYRYRQTRHIKTTCEVLIFGYWRSPNVCGFIAIITLLISCGKNLSHRCGPVPIGQRHAYLWCARLWRAHCVAPLKDASVIGMI